MKQQLLFADKPRLPHFDGATYEPVRDQVRLTGQLARVYDVLVEADGDRWRTLSQIRLDVLAITCGEHHDSEAGISARLRDLRKKRFGGHTVERRNVGGGVWEYRLVVKP